MVGCDVGMDEGCVSGPDKNTVLNTGVSRHTAPILLIALAVSREVTLLEWALRTNFEQKDPSLSALRMLCVIAELIEPTDFVLFTAHEGSGCTC